MMIYHHDSSTWISDSASPVFDTFWLSCHTRVKADIRTAFISKICLHSVSSWFGLVMFLSVSHLY